MAVAFRRYFLVLALVAVVLAAYMFRYEPMPISHSQIGTTKVWDRWTHRSCITSVVTLHRMVCDLEESQIEEILNESRHEP